MTPPPALLTLTELPGHFETDPHQEVRGLRVETVRALHGPGATDDVIVVQYRESPNLTFYDVHGRLIDVDHYLPSGYRNRDGAGIDRLLDGLDEADRLKLDDTEAFERLLAETLAAGSMTLHRGIQARLGIPTTAVHEDDFRDAFQVRGQGEALGRAILERFATFGDFLRGYLDVSQRSSNRYVHFTEADNIIITPLDRHAGLAVIIETQSAEGHLLPPADWRITRTDSPLQLEQSLVFRTPDVRRYFEREDDEPRYVSERYELVVYPDKLTFDSRLDSTDNLLTVSLFGGCFHALHSDPDVVIVQSAPREVTIVNSHGSVVPQRWLSKVTLPEPAVWVRADEDLNYLFAQGTNGHLTAYQLEENSARPVATIARDFSRRFALDQYGGLTLVTTDGHQLTKYATNINDLQPVGDAANFTTVFENIAHLFRGEALFERTVYAEPVTQGKGEEELEVLPEAIAAARFDFEANIDRQLAEAGSEYDKLTGIREKIAVARQNIADELTAIAERERLRLVGRRLQTAIGNIVRPAEQRVVRLLETVRAEQLLEEARSYKARIDELSEPGAFRDVLNALRAADTELSRMAPENVRGVLTEFRALQQELNASFSEQIAEDGKALRTFITAEIEQVERHIASTHSTRELENLLSTHPAALELLALLKQPFVLQSVAKERTLSPAGVQSRLYKALQQRRKQLVREEERKAAEIAAAKVQLAGMIAEATDYFLRNHSGGFSELQLSQTPAYRSITADIDRLERQFADRRLANELREALRKGILERNRKDLRQRVAVEGKYAYVQNDPDLYVDLESTTRRFPTWSLDLLEKRDRPDTYRIIFLRNTDREVYRPTTADNLRTGRAFEVGAEEYADFAEHYARYVAAEYEFAFLDAVWEIANQRSDAGDYPQFNAKSLEALLPQSEPARKALAAALEKKRRDRNERTRTRDVPPIPADFIDDTPFFQEKLREFIIKAKLQLATGSGVLLLSGPPGTGKSAFLRFAAALMNREYFEHASDKWQTKNSLVTAIKFGENGPYVTPAGFTKAITTSHSLLNIEEIKEWPEALRKSLNPFFAGSDYFIAPDGTTYRLGDNILLTAAANLGSAYRQEDEPFTADFWSRIDVVEYDYAPHAASQTYLDRLHRSEPDAFLTIADLLHHHFHLDRTKGQPDARARDLARQFLEFLLLPKADEPIKREQLQQSITEYFDGKAPEGQAYAPEEAAKIALRRLPSLREFSPPQFFDLYDHFINNQPLRDAVLRRIASNSKRRYAKLQTTFRFLYYSEGCLRHLRRLFQESAGQTELEGTNREFIRVVTLFELMNG